MPQHPTSPEIRQKSDLAQALLQQGKTTEAEALYREILKNEPEDFGSLYRLGHILWQRGKLESALSFFERAARVAPGLASFHADFAVLLEMSGRSEEALGQFGQSLGLDPSAADVWSNQAYVLERLGRFAEALESCDRAIALLPGNADPWCNRGNALQSLGRLDEALDSYDHSITLDPGIPQTYYSRGNVLLALKRPDEAIASFDRAIALLPAYPKAFTNRGNALLVLRRTNEALESYDRALALDPHHENAWCNRGNALLAMSRPEAAMESFRRAVSLAPGLAEAHQGLANYFRENSRPVEALASFEQAFLLKPELDFVAGDCLHARARLCRWEAFSEDVAWLENKLAASSSVVMPFVALSLFDDPELHRRAAEIYAAAKHPENSTLGPLPQRRAPGKIRVGYFSADFHNHATAYLMAELFELHERERFEFYAFSFGPNAVSGMRQRLLSAFGERFFDVREWDDAKIARFSREQGIDIAVDLKGYTGSERCGIFAARAAPIQVNYLGYPGTLGVDYIDYVIADATVIPAENHRHFTEKLVSLPDCYQVNDAHRVISDRRFSRAELGLPEAGFVFCCFNNNYKILPDVFDGWMRILQAVPGSVLWLFEDNPTAARNLLKEAEARGVEAARLVFAKRLPLADHLARHRLADLFLDTLPYNAHTTASDALWAGLPVLTRPGQSFASRVAASLLKAVDLPEMIVQTAAEYEATAIALAQQPERLQALKAKLAANRLTTPLFDTARFARHIESAYQTMFERHQAGLPPEAFAVTDETRSDQSRLAPAAKGADIKPETSKVLPQKPSIKIAGLPMLLGADETLEIMDVGASCIAETPVYRKLLDIGVAHLNAFEGDPRHIQKIREIYGVKATVFNDFLADGEVKTLYLAHSESGMTSLLKPCQKALRFFNGFEHFGTIFSTEQVQTRRLDDVQNMPEIDFLKMDIQGSEMAVLEHGMRVLKHCLFMQLEVSWIPLYENQPTFGEVDVWMRQHGYAPHCFLDVKPWSITPTVKNGNFRMPFNQLLESDIVYMKDPLHLDRLDERQLKKMALIAHYCFRSYDLCGHFIRELIARNALSANTYQRYLDSLPGFEKIGVMG